jgi:hypothetical protein
VGRCKANLTSKGHFGGVRPKSLSPLAKRSSDFLRADKRPTRTKLVTQCRMQALYESATICPERGLRMYS